MKKLRKLLIRGGATTMHFSGDVSLGQLAVIFTIIGFGTAFHRSWVILTYRVGLMWAEYQAKHQMFERRVESSNSVSGE